MNLYDTLERWYASRGASIPFHRLDPSVDHAAVLLALCCMEGNVIVPVSAFHLDPLTVAGARDELAVLSDRLQGGTEGPDLARIGLWIALWLAESREWTREAAGWLADRTHHRTFLERGGLAWVPLRVDVGALVQVEGRAYRVDVSIWTDTETKRKAVRVLPIEDRPTRKTPVAVMIGRTENVEPRDRCEVTMAYSGSPWQGDRLAAREQSERDHENWVRASRQHGARGLE